MAEFADTFRPDIIELTGFTVEENIRRLGRFENDFEGLIQEGQSQFLASMLLDPGWGPGAFCDPNWYDRFKAFGEATRVANDFSQFSYEQFKLVERNMHGKLLAIWESLTPEERMQIRFHCVMTVMRSEESYLSEPHADSFDGTICFFALMSNKIGTRIYPAAQLAWKDANRTEATSPCDQFFHEMRNGPSQYRPDALRYNEEQLGAERAWKDGSCLILAPAVCHQIAAHQACNPNVNDATTDSASCLLATETDPRWFCRVTLEIIPAGDNASNAHGIVNPFLLYSMDCWPEWLREKVCLLVRDNIWGRIGNNEYL